MRLVFEITSRVNWTMTPSSQNPKEVALQEIESRLEREPGAIELQVERARLLIDLTRLDEAKDIYLGILTREPTHLIALNNLAAVLNMMGYYEAALKVYREVVKLEPDNLKARMNFADSLRDSAELKEARSQYEILLQKDPGNKNAHRGMSYVLSYLGEKEAAWTHHRKAGGNRAAASIPARKSGEEQPIPVLLLASPCGGNTPMAQLLDKKIFRALKLVPDFHDPAQPLPPHRFVLNAIGDADHCATALEAAQMIVERSGAPVLNFPARVLVTGRVENSRLLGALEGVVTPRIAALSRATLAGPNAAAVLEDKGFTFPLLLRTPGFHGGSHFLRVANKDALAQAVETLPGERLLAIEYLDARDDDGKIRKYRVMMIGGKLYPLHKAVSPDWMIHYYSAEMAHSAEHRAEDAAFLEDLPGVVGERAMGALARIQEALGLDYAGADFSLDRNGEVLLFEANATMVTPLPDKGEKWDYRRAPVQKIRAAVQEMFLAKAKAGQPV